MGCDSMISIQNIPQEANIFVSPPTLSVAKELMKDKDVHIPLFVRTYVPVGEIWFSDKSIQEMDYKYKQDE